MNGKPAGGTSISLKDQGHRFCGSPDGKSAKWLHPAVKAADYANWVDLTDATDAEMIAHFTPQPEQCELFAA